MRYSARAQSLFAGDFAKPLCWCSPQIWRVPRPRGFHPPPPYSLASDAARVARQNARERPISHATFLQRALQEIIACFPVYRTYVDGAAEPTDADRWDIDWALARARRR